MDARLICKREDRQYVRNHDIFYNFLQFRDNSSQFRLNLSQDLFQFYVFQRFLQYFFPFQSYCQGDILGEDINNFRVFQIKKKKGG